MKFNQKATVESELIEGQSLYINCGGIEHKDYIHEIIISNSMTWGGSRNLTSGGNFDILMAENGKHKSGKIVMCPLYFAKTGIYSKKGGGWGVKSRPVHQPSPPSVRAWDSGAQQKKYEKNIVQSLKNTLHSLEGKKKKHPAPKNCEKK